MTSAGLKRMAGCRVVILSAVLAYTHQAIASNESGAINYVGGLSELLYHAAAWVARPKEPPNVLSLLPKNRPIQPWPYRDLSSAVHKVHTTATHAVSATVLHAPLAGVTTDMMVWWFREGIYQQSSYPGDSQGTKWDNYILWHPRHHIHQRIVSQQHDQGPGEAAATRQQEAVRPQTLSPLQWEICEFMTSAEPTGYTASNYPGPAATEHEYFINAHAEVKQLDSQGLWVTVPSKTGLGDTFWNLKHEWRDTSSGLVVNSTQVVGVVQPAWRPLWYARLRNAIVAGLFSQGKDPRVLLQYWISHCIEEVGNLEHILPYLYARRHEGFSSTADSSAQADARPHSTDEL